MPGDEGSSLSSAVQQCGFALGGCGGRLRDTQRKVTELDGQIARLSADLQKAIAANDGKKAAELALQLQQALTKQQALMAALTNILKTMHEHALGVVRNIRG